MEEMKIQVEMRQQPCRQPRKVTVTSPLARIPTVRAQLRFHQHVRRDLYP
jgi:hypothetical protein